MMDSAVNDQIIEKTAELRQRYFTAAAALYLCKFISYAAFAAGLLFLLLRHMSCPAKIFPLIGLAALLTAVSLALLQAYRHRMPQDKALSVLESYNAAGGIIFSAQETGDSSWFLRLKVIDAPKVKPEIKRNALILLYAFAFCAASLLMPVSTAKSFGRQRMQADNQSESISGQIEALKNTEAVDEKEAEELKKILDQIINLSDATKPSQTFEALERLEDKLKDRASDKAEELSAELDACEQMLGLAENLKNSSSAQESAKTAEKLRQLMDTAGVDKRLGRDEMNKLADNLKKAAEGGAGSKQAAQKASDQLEDYIQNRRDEIARNAREMNNSRLIDSALTEQLQNGGGGTSGGSQIPVLEPRVMPAGMTGPAGKSGQGGESGATYVETAAPSASQMQKDQNGRNAQGSREAVGGKPQAGGSEKKGNESGSSSSSEGTAGSAAGQQQGSDVKSGGEGSGSAPSENGGSSDSSGSMDGAGAGSQPEGSGQGPGNQGGEGSVSGSGQSGSGSGSGTGDQSGFSPVLIRTEGEEGTAPLNFSRETSEHGFTMRDEALPVSSGAQLQDSVGIGMAVTAPVVSGTDAGTDAKNINWQKHEKKSENQTIILPKHRNAVRNYFEH